MDKEDIKLDTIKECLKKIITYYLWIGTIDILLLIGILQKQDNFTIGQFSFSLKYITISVILALLFFTFTITHKIHRIFALYKATENENAKESIKTYLNLYPSLLNPFAQQEEFEMSELFDNLGMGLQTFLYSFGYLLSFKYFLYASKISIVFIIIIVIILTVLRFDLVLLQKKTEGIVSVSNQKIKKIFHFLSLVIVLILVALI